MAVGVMDAPAGSFFIVVCISVLCLLCSCLLSSLSPNCLELCILQHVVFSTFSLMLAQPQHTFYRHDTVLKVQLNMRHLTTSWWVTCPL